MVSKLTAFARLLGLRSQDAEDALHSERVAKLVLSRRALFGASAAVGAAALLAEHTVWSFAAPAPLSSVHLVAGGEILQRWQPGQEIRSLVVHNQGPDVLAVALRRVVLPGTDLLRLAVAPGNSLSWMALPEHRVVA